MTNYFEKRKKKKLYKQWVDKSELPPESVPNDVDEKGIFNEDIDEDSGRRSIMQDGLSFRLTMRHFLYLILIITILLVTTVSLATILITRSC